MMAQAKQNTDTACLGLIMGLPLRLVGLVGALVLCWLVYKFP